MKDIKITNYTTKDWVKHSSVMLCIVILTSFTTLSIFNDKDHIAALMGIVGIVGWGIVYHIIMKEIRKRNPQE